MKQQKSRLLKSCVSREAFTLVELLVVIAIILVLVALLMPALGHVREMGYNVKCISNLRQIHIATFAYASDYNGKAPYDSKMTIGKDEMFVQWSRVPSHSSYRDYYPKNKWFAEYLKSGENGKMNPVGYCPLGGRLGKIGPWGANIPNISYGLNPDMFEDWWKGDPSVGGAGWENRCDTPLAQIANPSKVCLWVEANRNKVSPHNETVTGRHYAKSRISAMTPGPVIKDGGKNYNCYQYQGKANILFVDGHLSWLKVPDELPYYACYFWQPAKKHVCKAGQCNGCDMNVWSR